jgi:ribosomal-protein-alanine N-acetyltransferase
LSWQLHQLINKIGTKAFRISTKHQDILIRNMRHADCAALAEIESRYPSPWSASRIGSELICPRGIALVAEKKGMVVGWCCARFIDTEAEVLKIAVDPSYHRIHVGTRLMADSISCLTRWGVVTIFLEVRAANYPAIHFYGTMGFVQVGVRRRYYREPVEDGLLLGLNVTEHAKADDEREP